MHSQRNNSNPFGIPRIDSQHPTESAQQGEGDRGGRSILEPSRAPDILESIGRILARIPLAIREDEAIAVQPIIGISKKPREFSSEGIPNLGESSSMVWNNFQ